MLNLYLIMFSNPDPQNNYKLYFTVRNINNVTVGIHLLLEKFTDVNNSSVNNSHLTEVN